MTRVIGRPGDPAAVRSLRLDDVIATYVVDGVLAMNPTAFFPGYLATTGRRGPSCSLFTEKY